MYFAWSMLKGARPFTEKEDKVMRWILNILVKECPKTCSFFLVLPMDKMQFCWSDGMCTKEDNGIMGAWSMLTPYRTYFPSIKDTDMFNGDTVSKSGFIKDLKTLYRMNSFINKINLIVITHELEHWLQYRTNRVLFVINRFVTLFVDHIPILERIGIEYDARQSSETEELKSFSEELCNCIDSYILSVLFKHPDDPNNISYQMWNTEKDINGKPIHSEKIKQYAREFVEIINS